MGVSPHPQKAPAVLSAFWQDNGRGGGGGGWESRHCRSQLPRRRDHSQPARAGDPWDLSWGKKGTGEAVRISQISDMVFGGSGLPLGLGASENPNAEGDPSFPLPTNSGSLPNPPLQSLLGEEGAARGNTLPDWWGPCQQSGQSTGPGAMGLGFRASQWALEPQLPQL